MGNDVDGVEPAGEWIASLSRERRAELERIAFARPRDAAESEAAAEALGEIAAADAAVAAAARAARLASLPQPAAPMPTPVVSTDPEWTDDLAEHLPRRRSLVPLLIVIGLVVGLGAGVLASRGSTSIFSASAPPSPTPSASSGPITSANALNAIAQLGAPQTSQDVFPLQGFATSLDIEKKSVHRILITDDGLTLWIARSPEDICMLFTASAASATGDTLPDAGSTCATPFEFGSSGLSLQYGRDSWYWDGNSFTTTVN
jgi:hypothetical protein